MADDQLADVLRLCEEALARDGAERAAYLDMACGPNAVLRREVDAVLAEQSKSLGPLDTRDLGAEARLLRFLNGFRQASPSLAPGTRLGPYVIDSLIGSGGMGDVYKARDTRLDRTVAVKVLTPTFAIDPGRRARFEREAKAISGLNHPNICTLYDLGQDVIPVEGARREADQPLDFLVMEYLAGETLAARLEKGRLALDQALTIATQIADALAAAHRQGVIHRDLKPGNVMLTKAGAKLLDFGLAKLKAHGEQPATSRLTSAAMSSLTAEGTIVGTLQYMAPEQLAGRPADARTDLWALGAILYEMLAGKRPFEGTSPASLIGHIMNSEPPALATRQPVTPPGVDRLVRQCLAKDPDDRPDSAHDVANDLRWLSSELTATQPDVRALSGAATRVRSWRTAAATLAMLVAGLAGALGHMLWTGRPAPAVVWSSIELPAGTRLTEAGRTYMYALFDPPDSAGSPPGQQSFPYPSRTEFAMSPDGSQLVFSALRAGSESQPLLYLRSLDRAEAQPVAGTEGATQPRFSPDGRWVVYWANERLYKVSLANGGRQEVTRCRLPPNGIFWGEDGKIYWGSEGIRRIPAAGGNVENVTKIDSSKESNHSLPVVLPGGQAVLFTVTPDDYGDRAHVEVTSLPAGDRRTLIDDAADARYLPTGHLLFMRRGALMAAPFDPRRLTLGSPMIVVPHVEQALNAASPNWHSGAGQFSVSESGSLAYAPGGVDHFMRCEVVLVDRGGRTEVLPGFNIEAVTNQVRLSPDGKRLAFVQQSGPLWLFDLARATPTKISPDGLAVAPRWRPDGQRLAFGWSAAGPFKIWQISPEASDTLSPLVEGPPGLSISSWSRDGRFVAMVQSNPDTKQDILVWDVQKRTLTPFLYSPASEICPEFSPDGRWLAYSSDETGHREVFLRSFPDGVRKIPVSGQGGNEPAFSPDGRELFFLSWPPDKMMKVDIAPGLAPRLGRPTPLFDFQFLTGGTIRGYDLDSDGRRFICTRQKEPLKPANITRLTFVEHWFEELKARVPAR